jgi:hypothetical protein
VRPLSDARYPLDRFEEAFAAAAEGKKVILRVRTGAT